MGLVSVKTTVLSADSLHKPSLRKAFMFSSPDNSDADDNERLVPMGRVLFGAGIVLVISRALTLTTRMPGLPSFWYANQSMWVALGFGMTALGWWILWGRPKLPAPSWRPTIPGRRFRTATLYVGEGCPLCDDAAELLGAHQQWLPAIQEIDIQSDPTLVEKFKTCVPVVVLDGKIRFRGRIQTPLLRRLIEGTPPANSSSSSISP